MQTSEMKSRFHWHSFKGFFDNKTFNNYLTFFAIFSILVTIFGNIPSYTQIDVCSIRIELSKQLMFAFLILSALIFITSYYIYIIFCPNFIKLYPNYNIYKTTEHSPRWIVWNVESLILRETQLPKFMKRMLTKKYIKLDLSKDIKDFQKNPTKIEVVENQTVLSFLYGNSLYELSFPIMDNSGELDSEKTKSADLEIFWEIFARYSSSKMIIRIFLICSLLFSFVLFSLSVIMLIFFALHIIFYGVANSAILNL